MPRAHVPRWRPLTAAGPPSSIAWAGACQVRWFLTANNRSRLALSCGASGHCQDALASSLRYPLKTPTRAPKAELRECLEWVVTTVEQGESAGVDERILAHQIVMGLKRAE